MGNKPTAAFDAPMVGRSEAFDEIMASLAWSDDKAPSACLILGEAGVGKTRLLKEVVSAAADRSCLVLRGRAQEYDRGVAYATMRDLLASLTPPLPGAAGEELKRLLEACDQAAAAPDARDGSDWMSVLFSLTARLLRALAAGGGCVVALDDAHLADDETLTALCMASRQLSSSRFVLLCTARANRWTPGSAFAATLGRLIGDDYGLIVELSALSAPEIGALVGGTLGARADDRLVNFVFDQSRGNPLLAQETLRSLCAQDGVTTERGEAYLLGTPEAAAVSKRGALLHRVFQYREDCRIVAKALSVFGRIDLDHVRLLEVLTGLNGAAVRAAFDELTDAGVLEQLGGGWYQFSHPLIAKVLYDDMGPAEQRRVHALVAEDMRSRGEEQSRLLEYARHAIESARPGDREAVNVALQAAEATGGMAPLSAAHWYQRALDLLGPDDPVRGEILARQAISYFRGARADAALSAGVEAVPLMEAGALYDRLVVTIANLVHAMGRYDKTIELIDGLPRLVGDLTGIDALRCLILARSGKTGEALATVASVRQRLRPDAPGFDRVMSLGCLGQAAAFLSAAEDAEELAVQLEAVGTDSTGRFKSGTRLSALESAARVMADVSNVQGARRCLQLASEMNPEESWGDIHGQWTYTVALASFLEGSLETALGEIHGGLVTLDFVGSGANASWIRCLEIQVRIAQGQYLEAERLLSRWQLDNPSEADKAWRSLLEARVQVGQHSYEAGFALLAEEVDQAAGLGWRDVWFAAAEALVDGYLDLQQVDQAAEVLAGLAKVDNSPLRQRRSAIQLQLARVTTQPRLADQVLAEAERQGLGLLKAKARFTLAVLGQQPEANFKVANDLFAEMGAAPWQKRVTAVAREAGVTLRRGGRPANQGDTLTATERQLVELLRAGLSNREISEALHYSRKTVETYLTRLYRKTGQTSRIDLVLALERGEL